MLARLRVSTATLALFGVLWIPLIFPLIAALAFMGVLRPAMVWLVLLLPAATCLGAAAYLRVKEVRERRKFRLPEVIDREAAAQVSAWAQLYSQLGFQRSRSKNTLELRLAMGAVWLAAFFVLIPIALAAMTTVIPRFIVSNSIPPAATARFSALARLQEYRLPVDSSISAIDAGHALHNIVMAGNTRPASPLMRTPRRQHASVFEKPSFTRETNPEFWADSLFHFTRRGLTPAQRRLVDSAAVHPSHSDFQVLSRAAYIDIPSTRWDLRAADSVTVENLPYPFYRQLREASQAQIARAARQSAAGDQAGAEQTLKELLSAGFAIRESSPALLDAVIGGHVIRNAASSLASLYEQTGRTAEATDIRTTLLAAEQAQFAAASRSSMSIDRMYGYVLNTSNPRPARWEMFSGLQTAAPCMSFSAGLFGPGRAHRNWVKRARATLVQLPGDSAYFEIVKKGVASKKYVENPRCTPRTLLSFRRILMGY